MASTLAIRATEPYFCWELRPCWWQSRNEGGTEDHQDADEAVPPRRSTRPRSARSR